MRNEKLFKPSIFVPSSESCIEFVPKREEDVDFLKIHTGGFGCRAQIGYRRGAGEHLCHLMTPQCMVQEEGKTLSCSSLVRLLFSPPRSLY